MSSGSDRERSFLRIRTTGSCSFIYITSRLCSNSCVELHKVKTGHYYSCFYCAATHTFPCAHKDTNNKIVITYRLPHTHSLVHIRTMKNKRVEMYRLQHMKTTINNNKNVITYQLLHTHFPVGLHMRTIKKILITCQLPQTHISLNT